MARTRTIGIEGLVTTRERYDAVPSADYEALKSGPLVRERTGLAPMGAGFDWHLRHESQHLRFGELANDVDRNDLVVGQGISRFLDNVLQGGPKVDPNTGDDEADDILRDGWQEWGSDPRKCHSLGTMNWSQMRRTAMRATLVAGDIFQVMLSDNTADLMESHRCRTPKATTRNVVFGILKDNRGRHKECWFTKEALNPAQQLNNVGDTKPVPIVDEEGFVQVMHLIDRQRATQTRGLTKFAPMFKPMTIFDDTIFAQLVKEQIQSCITFLREIPYQTPPGTTTGTSGDVEVRVDGTTTKLLQKLFPGLEIAGNPGEMLKAFSPQVAGADFVNFSHLILTFLAINLDMPLSVFLLDATKGNFSSMRGVIMQARLAWQRWQRMQIDQQERPTYLWQVRAMFEERTRRGKRLRELVQGKGLNLYSHEWHLPEWEYIQPLQDVSSDALEMASGLTSPRRVSLRKQVDYRQLAQEIVTDRGYLMELAIKEAERLNAAYPNLNPPVDYRLLGSTQLPQGLTMNIMPPVEPAAGPEKKEPANAA